VAVARDWAATGSETVGQTSGTAAASATTPAQYRRQRFMAAPSKPLRNNADKRRTHPFACDWAIYPKNTSVTSRNGYPSRSHLASRRTLNPEL
jgi:hypothetical protein